MKNVTGSITVNNTGKRSIRYHTQFQEGKKYEKKSFISDVSIRYVSNHVCRMW